MGITIDRQAATIKFGQALVLARSEKVLPEEWLERTRAVGRASSKTFTPVLGTALLAKATDRFVDAFSLRESESNRSYSARSVAKEVLVPCCVRAGIDLRSRSPEPLNANPFYTAARISTDLKVRASAIDDLGLLCACIEEMDALDERNALEALAAFLRVRIAASRKAPPILLGPGLLSFADLTAALDTFVAGESEGGKIGQAVAAAILDLVFDGVRMKAVNDASSKWPGDIGVFIGTTQTAGIEVKQRPLADSEVLLFAQRLQEATVRRAVVVALTQRPSPLDSEQLAFQARRLHGVELAMYFSTSTLLHAAARWAVDDIPLLLERFPRLVAERLEELEVTTARLAEWAALFAVPSAAV